MNILADQYLYRLDELIPRHARLVQYNPDDGFPENAPGFDALLIRTVTKINPDTLPMAGKLKFIGSATAGFDHVDRNHLDDLGIAFARSAGCNANAVGEFVVTCLFRWAEENGVELRSKKVGVIGCGQTGGKVICYLRKLGIDLVLYDPPRAIREEGFQSAGLDEVNSCDILTFHTPLTSVGDFPTHHLCSEEWLVHGFDLVMNAARGGVVDEAALLKAKQAGLVGDFILDVWENEPLFWDVAAENAFIATPHVAGYSKQAKLQASRLVVDEMCRFFGGNSHEPVSEANSLMTPAELPEEETVASFLWKHSNIRYYDEKLRTFIGQNDAEKAGNFAKLRSETETRHEFAQQLKHVKTIPPGLGELTIFTG